MTAANTVSRASVACPRRAATISVTIRADLDDRHRDGQDQRAEGLADAVRDDLGVVHGGQHGTDEEDGDHGGDHRARVPAPRRHQHDQGNDRSDHRPRQQAPGRCAHGGDPTERQEPTVPRTRTATGRLNASGSLDRSPLTTRRSAADPARSRPVTSPRPSSSAASDVAVASASAVG